MNRRDFLVGAGSAVLAPRPGGEAALARPAAAAAMAAAPFVLGVRYKGTAGLFGSETAGDSAADFVADFVHMRAAGFNAVQIALSWAAVEPAPGRMVWRGFDAVLGAAAQAGLGLVLTPQADRQPPWLGRVIGPVTPVIPAMGRGEAPLCFDHPRVWLRLSRFLAAVAERYHAHPALRAWEAWDLGQDATIESLTCTCPATQTAFSRWLRDEYGALSNLNRAWDGPYQSQYQSWRDILPPATPSDSSARALAWTRFLTARTAKQAHDRADVIKKTDDGHPVLISAAPFGWRPAESGDPAYPLVRGNDWRLADAADGVGATLFPTWWKMDDADVAVIATQLHSSARHKTAWLSSLQAGRAARALLAQEPVDPATQQRWVWGAFAAGVAGVLMSGWEDDRVGVGAGGFGLLGGDGFGGARLRAVQTSSDVMQKHAALIGAYRPTKPRVGVLFSPRSVEWQSVQSGTADAARDALESYGRALTRLSVPWLTVEDDHLDAVTDLALIFLPRTTVVTGKLEDILTAFVAGGGTLVAEAECGAYNVDGRWLSPSERFLARRFGIREVGRRDLVGDAIPVLLDDWAVTLPAVQWLSPIELGRGRAWATHADGDLVAEVAVEKGRVIAIGAYVADPYQRHWTPDFEAFVLHIVGRAGLEPDAEVLTPTPSEDACVFVRTGESGARKVAVVFAPAGQTGIEVRFRSGFFPSLVVTDILSGESLTMVDASRASKAGMPLQGTQVTLPMLSWGLAVLVA